MLKSWIKEKGIYFCFQVLSASPWHWRAAARFFCVALLRISNPSSVWVPPLSFSILVTPSFPSCSSNLRCWGCFLPLIILRFPWHPFYSFNVHIFYNQFLVSDHHFTNAWCFLLSWLDLEWYRAHNSLEMSLLRQLHESLRYSFWV